MLFASASPLYASANCGSMAIACWNKSRAFEIELLSMLGEISRFPFGSNRRGACGHAKIRQLRQRIDRRLGDTVAEVLDFRITRGVLERDDEDRPHLVTRRWSSGAPHQQRC